VGRAEIRDSDGMQYELHVKVRASRSAPLSVGLERSRLRSRSRNGVKVGRELSGIVMKVQGGAKRHASRVGGI